MDVAIDLTAVRITTDRLLLRAWTEADLADFNAYASVDGVGEMAGWRHHESVDESRKILESFIADKSVFALEHREDHRVIGSLGLHNSWANEDETYRHLKAKEIGYVLSKNYWGKGLMPEAVRAVIAFCFDSLGLEALTICHFRSNGQSARVIEKCGFSFVREVELYSKQLEQTFDDRNYILLRP